MALLLPMSMGMVSFCSMVLSAGALAVPVKIIQASTLMSLPTETGLKITVNKILKFKNIIHKADRKDVCVCVQIVHLFTSCVRFLFILAMKDAD